MDHTRYMGLQRTPARRCAEKPTNTRLLTHSFIHSDQTIDTMTTHHFYLVKTHCIEHIRDSSFERQLGDGGYIY